MPIGSSDGKVYADELERMADAHGLLSRPMKFGHFENMDIAEEKLSELVDAYKEIGGDDYEKMKKQLTDLKAVNAESKKHFQNIIDFGMKINPERWKAMVESWPLSPNIEDRRGDPEDIAPLKTLMERSLRSKPDDHLDSKPLRLVPGGEPPDTSFLRKGEEVDGDKLILPPKNPGHVIDPAGRTAEGIRNVLGVPLNMVKDAVMAPRRAGDGYYSGSDNDYGAPVGEAEVRQRLWQSGMTAADLAMTGAIPK